jgi:ribose 5-phosphate isomerase B
MKNITIAIGTDHRGYALKEFLKTVTGTKTTTISWIDVGCFSSERTDYPPFAYAAVQKIIQKKADYGVLLCGSGIGVVIVANRFRHIYAGLVWNEKIAQMARQDDNCNIIGLPADFITEQQAQEILAAWLDAEFKKGRYAERLAMIDELPIK